MSLRGGLYRAARALGDVHAVTTGRVGRRIARRAVGRETGRALGRAGCMLPVALALAYLLLR
jgi:hypothetical protein